MMHYRLPIRQFLLILAIVLSSQIGTLAKDTWIQVRSKNFFLVGNASEKDIRKVGTKLEQFRETFRLLFSEVNLTASIPTNVVVFKNDSSFRNFKPKRADGKIDNFVVGYFQPGEDVNYISLSAEGDGGGNDTRYNVIFHEYVHFIVNTNFGKTEIPPWFNEGLAEYYETFAIEDDQKIKLGLPQVRHLDLLAANRMMPLAALFGVTNHQLLQSGDHSRSTFYAESWALIHYLTQSGRGGEIDKFLGFLLKGVPAERAFKDAFKEDYGSMEKELQRYVSQNSYKYREITFKKKLTFDGEMSASPLDDADSNAYLGDLLYHSNRLDDAEPFLLNALAAKPRSGIANTTLGMVKLRQRKFDESKKYLELAIAGDPKNHVAYYQYAFLLSREGRDDLGYVRSFSKEDAEVMRQALRKAIDLNPSFTESYELLAFVNLVNNEQLDESVALLQAALRYQPGNQRYALRIAEIQLRQEKFEAAAQIAQKIAATADDPGVKARADDLLLRVGQLKELSRRSAEQRRGYEDAVALGKTTNNAVVTEDPDANMRAINEALRHPRENEKRVIGSIQKVTCKTRPIAFEIRTAAEGFVLNSADLDSLALNAFTPEANKIKFGCDEDIRSLNAVLTYRPSASTKGPSRGELVAVEFVSADFRFLDPLPVSVRKTPLENSDRMAATGVLMEPPPARSAEGEELRRQAITRSINEALVKPSNGQKREMGFLDKIECSGRTPVFLLHTDARSFRLLNSLPSALKIGVFVPDLAGMEFGCAIKPVEFPAVFVYNVKPDSKTKTDGEIVSLEFVPRAFVLDTNAPE